MLRTESGDQLLYEEYAPVRETLLGHGHIKLRRHLTLIVESSIPQTKVQQVRQKMNGRINFLPPSIVVPHRLTDSIIDALREPALDPKSTGIVGREAILGFIESYNEVTDNSLTLN